jgi:hypothetical protein
MTIGVLRLARTARVRWEPVSLLAGALLTVVGFVQPAVGGAFLLGVLVLIAALLKGIRDQHQGYDPVGHARRHERAEVAQSAGAEPARCSMACAYSRPAR